jgi:hypothetical protein
MIALMMEAVRTSETSVNFYETTRRNIPEGCHRFFLSFPPFSLPVPLFIPFLLLAVSFLSYFDVQCLFSLHTSVLCLCRFYSGSSFKLVSFFLTLTVPAITFLVSLCFATRSSREAQ